MRRRPFATPLLLVAAVVALVATGRPGADDPAPATTSAASEDWPDDAVVYHVFVDRFADGDGSNEAAAAPDHDTALMDWMGGDLAGVRDHLDHVVAVGANTIWLSPVTPGPGYHGYHPTDLTDVDPRFGTVDDLRGLVDDAHARGLKVVYDLVLNHTSDQHPWFRAAQADCDGPYVAYYEFRDCPDRYAGFAGLAELPELDLDHPEVWAWVADEVLPFWLDDVGVDGFRLDHAQGPSREFWAAFDAEVEARWPGTLLLGEVWAQQAIIDSYGDVLDAATAFPLRDRLVAVIARGGDVRALHQPVEALLGGDGPRPATYVSSHDQPRFLTEAGGDARRLALAYAALLTLPGLPVVYYGDEVGLGQSGRHGAVDTHQDRYFREPMPWDEAAWDARVLATVSRLARLRTVTPALHSGDYVGLVTEGDTLVFERVAADGDRILVVLANGEGTATVDVGDLVAGGPPQGQDLLAPGTSPAGPLEVVEVDAPGVGVWRLTGPAA